jgi:hypothetical protein
VINALRRHGSITLAAGDVLRIGRTMLRIHDPDAPVPAAVRDELLTTPQSVAGAPTVRVRHEPAARPRWLGGNARGLAIAAVAAVAIGLNVWSGTADGSGTGDIISLTLGIMLIGAAWAAIWAIIGRAFVHRFDFAGHLAIVSLLFVAGLALIVVQEWLNFLFPDSGIVTTVSALSNLALVTTLIALHLSLATSVPRRRIWKASLGSAVAAFAVGAVFALADDDQFSDVPVFSNVIKPLAPNWVPTNTIEEFAKVPQALKLQVDEMATKQ